jgi:DNA-binding response OmpR family regulator/cell division protein FtsN
MNRPVMAAARKVLVIDDDAAACRRIEEALTRCGIEVQSSHDQRTGLEAAKAIIPDLIFINLLLPDTNGLKMSKAIHAVKNLEKVPVIMLISHEGELDPKYTVTIGIPDILVKPLKEAEIIAKTKAVLGEAVVTEAEDETFRELSFEEEMEPMILHDAEEMDEEAALASEMETPGRPISKEYAEQNEREALDKLTTEGESYMPEKENPSNRKEDDDRNLFTDESDIFGEELKKSRDEAGGQLMQEKQAEDSFPENDVDSSFEEEKPANSLRRVLLIVASIVAGIALGVGGYLFFTAGSKHASVEKQVARVLPEPAAIPMPPAVPSEKPNVIPEIPVKSEPQKTETAQAKPRESLSKPEARKEPVQKAEPEKSNKETAPVAAAKSEEKELSQPKQSAKKETPARNEKRAYYVQAGLFEHEANAKAMAGKLKQKGYIPSVKKIAGKNKKVLFRVTVGTYANFKEAAKVSEALNKHDIKAIVRKQ